MRISQQEKSNWKRRYLNEQLTNYGFSVPLCFWTHLVISSPFVFFFAFRFLFLAIFYLRFASVRYDCSLRWEQKKIVYFILEKRKSKMSNGISIEKKTTSENAVFSSFIKKKSG